MLIDLHRAVAGELEQRVRATVEAAPVGAQLEPAVRAALEFFAEDEEYGRLLVVLPKDASIAVVPRLADLAAITIIVEVLLDGRRPKSVESVTAAAARGAVVAVLERCVIGGCRSTAEAVATGLAQTLERIADA